MNVKKLTLLAMSVALSMILSFVESQIPPLAAVPGIKIGLANIVTVFLIYTLGSKEAACVSLIRVALSSLLFGTALTFMYSLAGAVLSFLFMIIFKKIGIFSTVGVSVIGGVMHNAAQIAVACIVMETAALSLYLPPLIVSGVVAGVAVGVIAGIVSTRLSDKIKKI